MKKVIMREGMCGSILAVLILPSLSFARSKHVDNGNGKNAATLLTDARTTQYSIQECVSEVDMENILQARINAPSTMNRQPWHFTAVTNREILQQISDKMSANRLAQVDRGESTVKKAGIADTPLAIIIPCQEGSEFDIGLACQNMLAEAELLGYGGRILSFLTIVLNGDKKAEYRSLLGIPEDRSAAAVLLVGSEDRSADETMDGVTGPSVRSNAVDMVTYVTSEQEKNQFTWYADSSQHLQLNLMFSCYIRKEVKEVRRRAALKSIIIRATAICTTAAMLCYAAGCGRTAGEAVGSTEQISDNAAKAGSVIFSWESGFYEQEFVLELSTDTENGIIRYALGGSDPVDGSPEYVAGITITNRTGEENLFSNQAVGTLGRDGGFGSGGGTSGNRPGGFQVPRPEGFNLSME